MRYKESGFTLIELLLAMAIVMILSVIGITSFTIATVKSRDTQRKGDINQIVKALESFNQDMNRYPISSSGAMQCFDVVNKACDTKLYATIGGVRTDYIKIPSDPTNGRSYYYVSDGATFALYGAIENESDKDLLIDPLTNKPYVDPWGISCGSGIPCNYQVTEEGLIKTKT